MNKLTSFKNGVKAGIPIGLGYFAVSFTFGMLACNGGLNIKDAVLISLTNLTSAGQFAGLNIILSNGTYLEMMMSQLIINLRYMLMSFSLSTKLDRNESFFHRYLVAFGVTDEIYAVSISQSLKTSAFFNYGAMSVAIPGWVFGTLFGGLFANILPAYIVTPLSLALYGMFIAIIIPPSKKNKNILYVIIGSCVLSSILYFGPKLSSGFSVIICTVFVSLLAAKFAPIKEEANDE